MNTEPTSPHKVILLVDDEAAIRCFLRLSLAAQDYEVIEAASSRQAIEKLAGYSRHIDLLITDILLPDMNGYDLMTRIRPHYSDLKVLFISGYVRNSCVRNCLSDTTAFLAKPFAIETILSLIESLLAGRYVAEEDETLVVQGAA